MSSGRPTPVTLTDLPVISPTSEVDRLSILIYGKPGVGKTVLAGTAEDDERTTPVLYCDAEGGRLSISHRGATNLLKVYPIVEYSRDVHRLANYFLTGAGVRRDSPYHTIVIDSLSELTAKLLETVVGEGSQARALESISDRTDWNEYTQRAKSLVRFFRDLPAHIIVTALEEEYEGKVQPMFPGRKLASQIPAIFNMVGRLYMAPTADERGVVRYERRLLLQSETNVTAKDRSDRTGQLPREIVAPTITKLLDRMAEGRALAHAAQTAHNEHPASEPPATDLPTTTPTSVK